MTQTITSSFAQLDRALAELHANKARWSRLPIPDRVKLIDEMLICVRQVAKDWVRRSHEAKGIDPKSAAAGEDWLTGPYLLARNLRLLRRSLLEIESRGTPRIPGRPRLENGRVVAPVFPTDFYDRVMFRGYRAEVWMQPEVTLNSLRDTMATAYQQSDATGAVCLVFGAGNVSSIGPMDAFYKLFVENQVVALKLHPELIYLRSCWEDA